MEKIKTTDNASTHLLIDCTPGEIKELVDKLLMASRSVLEGYSVIIPISKTVALHYKVKADFKFSTAIQSTSSEASHEFTTTH